MRSLLYLGTALFMSQFLAAQTLNDVSYLTRSGLYGSARYTSMAGAFGALGGDLSAINVNPAGSAVFNDNQYEIDSLGIPFLAALGREIYQFEKRN